MQFFANVLIISLKCDVIKAKSLKNSLFPCTVFSFIQLPDRGNLEAPGSFLLCRLSGVLRPVAANSYRVVRSESLGLSIVRKSGSATGEGSHRSTKRKVRLTKKRTLSFSGAVHHRAVCVSAYHDHL